MIQLELEETCRAMACPSCHRRRKNWAWQIVAGRVRPHEKQIRRTARAPAARCGASGARPNRRASDLCFRSARNARLAPACPDGRFDRMMTLFLRSGTSRTTGPACWPRLGGANRGSTDLNWTLIGVARVCRTSLQVVFYSSRNENHRTLGTALRWGMGRYGRCSIQRSSLCVVWQRWLLR